MFMIIIMIYRHIDRQIVIIQTHFRNNTHTQKHTHTQAYTHTHTSIHPHKHSQKHTPTYIHTSIHPHNQTPTCRVILMRSSGAVQVRDTIPAVPPATKCFHHEEDRVVEGVGEGVMEIGEVLFFS